MVTNAQLQQQMESFQKSILESIHDLKKTSQAENQDILEKIDGLSTRLNTIESGLSELSEAHDELSQEVDSLKTDTTDQLKVLTDKIDILERKVKTLEGLPEKVNSLTELTEERTNRQLRETLVFKNVPEINDDETYAETKEVLAKLISEHCNLQYDDVFLEIKRAHRESKRRNLDNHYRKGKRLIFVAMHSWDLCQTIIETFRSKNIRNPEFQIMADQKYGPLTTRRRSLAFQKRKELKANGEISGGYVNFPAKLMVNVGGQVDNLGKKIYKLHTDFSKHEIQ
jgi:hypothetical protein